MHRISPFDPGECMILYRCMIRSDCITHHRTIMASACPRWQAPGPVTPIAPMALRTTSYPRASSSAIRALCAVACTSVNQTPGIADEQNPNRVHYTYSSTCINRILSINRTCGGGGGSVAAATIWPRWEEEPCPGWSRRKASGSALAPAQFGAAAVTSGLFLDDG